MDDINKVANVDLPDMSGKAKDENRDISQKPKGVFEKKNTGVMDWLLHHFMAMKPKDILENVFENVVDPGLRLFASNVIDAAKNLFLFGEGGAEANGYTHYGKSSEIKANGPSQKDKTRGNFTNVELYRSEDALGVRRRMLDRLAEYGEVTVAYFYEQCGIDASQIDYTDEKYGWTRFPGGLNVIPTQNGKYKLNLPEAKPLAK